jgi:hypothetical protein
MINYTNTPCLFFYVDFSFLEQIKKKYERLNLDVTFILVSILVLAFVTHLKFPHFWNTRYMQDRWFNCLELLFSGTLYGGQPYCMQGPFLYHSLSMVYLLFSDHLYYSFSFVGIFLNTTILYFSRLIIEKETKQKVFLGFILLYAAVVYFHFLSSLWGMLISTLFFMVGLYLLFYTNMKYKELFSVLFFFLAIFTKLTVLIPTFFAFAYYFLSKVIQVSFKNGELMITVEQEKEVISLF